MTATPVRPEQTRSLSGTLGVGAIVLMVVAAASPLTVIGGAAPLGVLLGNGIGFPAMYAVAGVVLLLFTIGLSAMSRAVPRPGAFFTYIGHGLGRSTGVAGAWLALLTYTAVQLCVYGYIGAILAVTFEGLGVAGIPWWVYSLAVVAVVGVLGYVHIDLSAKVLGVLLIGEILIVLALVVAVLATGGAEGLSAEPFAPSHVLSGAPGIGLMMAIAAFIGFESTAIYRSEAKDPDVTVPRATYVAVIGVALFYTVSAWALIMAWGPSQAIDTVAADYANVVIITMGQYLGPVGYVVTNVLLVTSMFACVLSFHNVLTRYQHSMAGGGLLPIELTWVHKRQQSPYRSSLLQTITAAVLVTICAVLGLDPVLQVFTWFSGVATLAIVVMMAVTAVAVVAYFVRAHTRGRLWSTRIAPVLGFLGLVGFAAAVAVYFPVLVGDVDAEGEPVFGVVSALLVGSIPLFALIGYGQALYLKRFRSSRYARVLDTIADAGA
ncbi:APC family permease [Microbacterium marinilacus]|uniref:APC family permease n=1 Tax=Microbacterium marinilacus TaxID=415209 RepID=A0ABP7BVW4_9MICO|nr:APC family permease [Microbacterium marinilacus]MBY0688217.1 APC family permease [Microbacterium marinilacus]